MTIEQGRTQPRPLWNRLRAWLRDPLSRPRQPKLTIAALALVMIVAIWAAAIQQVHFEARFAATMAMRQNNNRVGGFEQYLLRTFDAGQMALDQVITAYAAKPSAPANPVMRLTVPGASRTIFPAALVADDRGRIVASTANIAGDGMPAPLVARIRPLLARAGSLYVSVPIHSPRLGADFIYILRSFNLPGRRPGVAAVLIAPRQFLLSSAHITFGPDDSLSLVGPDGIVRVRRIGDRISYGEDISETIEMRGPAAYPNASYQWPDAKGLPTHYFSRRRLAGYPLLVMSVISVDSAFARVRPRGRLYLGAAVVATGLLGLSLLFAFAAIDQRQRRESEIRKIHARLLEAQLIGQIGDWNYVPASDRFYWSPSLRQMYERDPAQPVSNLEEVGRYVSPGAMRTVHTMIDHVMRTGERQEYELAVRLTGGSHRIHQFIMVPTYATDGSITGVHGTDQDITNLKRLETLEAKIVHLSRLDAMNVMAATLAHEINQPLTAALNYVMAGRRLLGPLKGAKKDEVEDLLRRSETQIEMAGDLLRNVRASVSSRPDRRRVPILDVWREAVPLVEGLHPGRGIVFEQEIAPGAELVFADPVQIRQVLTNLMSNAVEAVPAGRVPTVRLIVRRHSPRTIEVSVQDNGNGINIVGDDLFSPFASTKDSGMGLGLALSRTIVEAHQGKIWVARSDASGTLIAFTLPATRT